MAKVEHRAFGSMRPGRFPELLAPGEAQLVTDAQTNDGTIEPVPGLSATLLTLASGSQVQTIYRFGQSLASETQYWFEHTDDADFVKGPVADDTEERTYFTGLGGYPRKTNASLATGVAPLPVNSYRMGVVRPGGSPGMPEVASTFTPTCIVSGTGSGDNITVIYTTTYVTTWGEESPQSLSSAEVTYQVGQTVTVTLPAAPTGNYSVDSVRLYRSNTGSGATQFQFVTEVAVGTADYADTTLASALGETLGSSTFTEPDDSMIGLTLLPNGGMMGFFQNQLCFCEPGYPHAWPIRYRRSMAAPIVAVGAFDSAVVVFTTRGTYLLSGTEPANMVESNAALPHVCVSKRSVKPLTLNGMAGVVFAANDGLYSISGGGIRNLVEPIMASEDWEAYAPSTMLGLVAEDTYIGFFDDGDRQAGIVLRLGGSATFAETAVYATAGFFEPSTGVLFLAVAANALKKWEGGSTATYLFRSGVARSPYGTTMAAARVEATAYPVTFRFYADDTLLHTEAVANDKVFRLPGGQRHRKFYYEIAGTSRVSYVGYATSADELGRPGD